VASQLYPKGKAHILGLATKADLVADNLKLLLIDTADETYNAADEFHSDITGAGIVATSGNLAGKSVTSGTFDANDITLTGVTGDTVEAVVLYKDTGTSGTSPLIAWFDISTFTPNGSDVTVVFNASGLFAI
jgi:hypothetical protein